MPRWKNLNNPAYLKLLLLCEGTRIGPRLAAHVGNIYAKSKLAYNNPHRDLGNNATSVVSEILLPSNIVCAVRHRQDSRWQIELDKDNQSVLFNGDCSICPVMVPKKPKYYGVQLIRNITVDMIATQYSIFGIGVFLSRLCQFWRAGLQCSFCSLGGARQRDLTLLERPSEELVLAAIRAAVELSPDIQFVEWSSGTEDDFNEGFARLLSIAEKTEKMTARRIVQHAITMPPSDLPLIRRLSLFDQPTFSIEVWNEALFAKLCPGKNLLYGRNEMLRALEAGVGYLGKGRITCNIVAGLDTLSDVLTGLCSLAEIGVVPTTSVFHPDEGSDLADASPPCTEYMEEVALALREIYRKHEMRPFLPNARRASIDGEIYNGYFED